MTKDTRSEPGDTGDLKKDVDEAIDKAAKGFADLLTLGREVAKKAVGGVEETLDSEKLAADAAKLKSKLEDEGEDVQATVRELAAKLKEGLRSPEVHSVLDGLARSIQKLAEDLKPKEPAAEAGPDVTDATPVDDDA
jgi:uncharacterized protein with von Willebrand factor type A (vWA) domain